MSPTSTDGAKRKKYVTLIGYAVMVAVLFAGLEFTAFAYYYLRDGKYISVRERLDSGMGNIITAAGGKRGESQGCRWVDSIYPHPYLAYVLHKNGDCAVRWPNAQGLVGRDFPAEREKDYYNVMLTGGSVAMFLGQYFPGKPFYLEEELNRCYVPPKGKEFRVYNAALGGWRYPQETFVFSLFGRAFDALVTFEGGNEYHALVRLQGGPYGAPNGRLETANTDFSEITTAGTDSYKIVTYVYIANTIMTYTKRIPGVRSSYLAYAAADGISSLLQRGVRKAIEKKEAAGRTTVGTLLSLPEDWDRDHVVKFNLEQYKWHLANLHAMAKAQGIPSITFFQPVPSYYKPLTDEEKRVYGGNVHDIKPLPYLTMVDELMKLKAKGIPVYSLVKVFEGRKETIYADPIHFEIDGVFPDSKFYNSGVEPTGRSLGYELVAKAMAEKMSAQFGFKRKACKELR